MSDYLKSIIFETQERADFLKTKIHLPLKYPELTGLANRCVTILDEQICSLSELTKTLGENNERSVWRNVRDSLRIIEMVEKWGIPALYNQTEDVGLLNKIAFDIHTEINLPLEPPPVSILSTDYYYTAPLVDVIFVPLSESGFLLHLSDLYHEMGHYVSKHRNETKLESIGKNYLQSYEEIVEYFDGLLKNRERQRGPDNTVYKIKNYFQNWKKYWLEEFFCDLFAIYLLGPAYAWSHLHLVTKNNPNIFKLYPFSKQTHPSDEARMEILLIALQLLNFEKDKTQIEDKWREVTKVWKFPPTEYRDAFPKDLLQKIAEFVLSSLKQSNFFIFADDLNADSDLIRFTINQAWEHFWTLPPREFREWEKQTLSEFKGRYFKI